MDDPGRLSLASAGPRDSKERFDNVTRRLIKASRGFLGMRGVVSLCLLLAAAFSGCVEFVDGSQADLDAAAAEADKALADYQAKAGHIAGTVTAFDGTILSGATVDLVGTTHSAVTDDLGEFAFIDLVPATYTVRAAADGYLDTQQEMAVEAGAFTRPTLKLEAVPEAEPYYEVYSMYGFSEMAFGPLGIMPFYCDCDMEVGVNEDLSEVILEAEMESSQFLAPDAFEYWIEAEETSYAGEGYNPMYVQIPGEEFSDTEWLWVHVQPSSSSLGASMQQAFTVYLSLFYLEPAPEGWTAFDLE